MGIFRVHYKEYLALLIDRNKIDPLCVMNIDEMRKLLARAGIHCPCRQDGQDPKDYKKILEEVSHVTSELLIHLSRAEIILNNNASSR